MRFLLAFDKETKLMGNKDIITNDDAIRTESEDLLNYYPFAEKIKEIIQGYSSNVEPLTIGIYGKWGDGKTSLLNLIEKHIELFQKDISDKPYIKFHYNPWLYQSKEEMLFDFFETLSTKLSYKTESNLKKAGKYIRRYSRYLKSIKLSASAGIPKVFNTGVSVEPYEILQKLGENLEGKLPSIEEMKRDINDELKKANKKILIFIDDIDRLDKDEVFTLFKLIKINADFKNLVFIICLDPEHVAKAIHIRYGNNINDGKLFLEKIINIPIELPLVEEADLDFFIKEKIKPILNRKKIKKLELDELHNSIKGSYFDNPREVLRILNSFAISLYAIGEEVNIHDLFWIEYLKIKHVEVYQKIKNYGKNFKSKHRFNPIITFNESFAEQNTESGLRREIKDNYPDAITVIDSLFRFNRQGTISAYQNPFVKHPSELDSELRIQHVDHFEKYFSFHTKGKISELSFSYFKSNIIANKNNDAKEILLNIIENSGERKAVYRIKSEIEVSEKELQDKLSSFLVENLDLYKETSINPHSIEIIETIAEKLKQNPSENKEICLSIIEKMNAYQLNWFLGRFRYNNNIEYIESIEKTLIKKTISSEHHPFFKIRETSKLTMEVWSKHSLSQLQDYILKYLDKEENIFFFFKSFPYLWNETINGIFKKEDFDYMTDLLKLDSKLIFDKIKSNIPDIDNLDKLEESLTWDDHSDNSGLQNSRQFAYWHLKKMKEKRN